MRVTSPPRLETSMLAAFKDGSENILALMSVAIAASSGLPILPHDDPNATAKTATSIGIVAKADRYVRLEARRFILASENGSQPVARGGGKHELHSLEKSPRKANEGQKQ